MQEKWHKATRRRNNSRKAALKTDTFVRMSQRTSPKCQFDTVEGPITIFQVYAPDSCYSEDVAEEFYDMLQSKIYAIPRKAKPAWSWEILMPK